MQVLSGTQLVHVYCHELVPPPQPLKHQLPALPGFRICECGPQRRFLALAPLPPQKPIVRRSAASQSTVSAASLQSGLGVGLSVEARFDFAVDELIYMEVDVSLSGEVLRNTSNPEPGQAMQGKVNSPAGQDCSALQDLA